MVATVCLRTGPPSAGEDPGTTTPRAGAAPSGPAQKRDNETHRPVNSRLRREVADRGPQGRLAARFGSGEKPEGKRLAPDTGHRVDKDPGEKDLPLHAGGRSGGRLLSDEKWVRNTVLDPPAPEPRTPG